MATEKQQSDSINIQSQSVDTAKEIIDLAESITPEPVYVDFI